MSNGRLGTLKAVSRCIWPALSRANKCRKDVWAHVLVRAARITRTAYCGAKLERMMCCRAVRLGDGSDRSRLCE